VICDSDGTISASCTLVLAGSAGRALRPLDMERDYIRRADLPWNKPDYRR